MHILHANMSAAGLSQQFCVRWNSHLGSLGAAFPQLLAGQRFVDVTLACEGHQVHCHRLVLAACSTYFENLLGENPCQHPIIILPRDIKLWAIQALVDFMYKGEVNVSQAGLPDLMKCAEILKIRGLCGSDAALNLNQIHSPPGNYQQQQQRGEPADGVMKTSEGFLPRSGSEQQEQHSRSQQSNPSSGPKGHLLKSLRLQPISTRSHHQPDDGSHSDTGNDSGNDMQCIKTEDLIIDEDTVGQCGGDDEELGMEDNDKMPTDAIRCEQFLGVQAMDAGERVNARIGRDATQDRAEEEVEEGEKVGDGSMVEKSEESQGSDQLHDLAQDDYDTYANENEGDDEDNDVMEVSEEAEEVPITKKGANGKEMRSKVRRPSVSHSDSNNELVAIYPTSTLSIDGSSSVSTNSSANKGREPLDPSGAADKERRSNGGRSIGAVPSLSSITSVRSAPPGSRGSIRVKSIENLFENYQAKQLPKSSRDKRRTVGQSSVLVLGCAAGASNSEHESSASENANSLPSSLVYNSGEMDIYVKSSHQEQRRRSNAEEGEDETNSSMITDGDGYENIICSPNFPQLTGVVGGYKAEEDEEDEDYGDEYAIQLMAEEIDSNMLANGAESEGDEILYKPPPLMAIGGAKGTRGNCANSKAPAMRTYGRVGGMGNGNGTTSTLTIRKIDRQARGNVTISQANSLARANRRPRLGGRSKEAFHQLINANGAPPPIAFTLRNPRGNQPRTYNTEALWAALMDVKAGESIYRASQMHKVPRKTLRNWMKRWDIKSAYPMPRQLKEAAEKKRIIKELTSQIQ